MTMLELTVFQSFGIVIVVALTVRYMRNLYEERRALRERNEWLERECSRLSSLIEDTNRELAGRGARIRELEGGDE